MKLKPIEKRLLTLTEENKIKNKFSGGKNTYFTVQVMRTLTISVNNGLLSIESVKEFLRKCWRNNEMHW